MIWPEPTLFLWGLFGLTVLGALLPLDVGPRRQDHIVLTITATVVLALLGPRGLLLVWGAVLVACLVRRRRNGWLVGTAAAITVGFSLAHVTYAGVLDRDYPFRVSTEREFAIATLTLLVAWTGTMSVRVVLHRFSAEGPGRLDPFDSALVPYLLPTVAGGPILAAAIALYREESPWSALVMLLWCLPLYGACRFDLHRRRLAQQLRRTAEARQRLAAIGEVTARIVHQSRHQAGLMGWSIHRLRRLVDDPAAHHELDVLAGAKQRIQETFAGELLHEPVTVVAVAPRTLAATVDEVCAQLRSKAADRGVAVETDVDPVAGGAAVPAAVREALFNLVDNATDAAVTEVRVVVRPGAHETELVVHDDGPGIPDTVAARVYEPFFTTKDGGTGMGLAIADALVAELGGHLRHERRDEGTTAFVLTVPINQ